MDDQTLPMKGGWVMVKRKLPTEIQLPLLSIFYAMPDRVFEYGALDAGYWPRSIAAIRNGDLTALYRLRAGARNMLPSEVESAKALESDGVCLYQRVKVNSPWGTVSVEPYEWTPIEDLKPYLEAVGHGYTLHEYGSTAQVTSKLAEQLFYLQSRGITRSEAIGILLGGSAAKPGTVWLEADKSLIDVFFYDQKSA